MAAKVVIPEFQATALDAIPTIASNARATFRTHKTKDLRWRIVQLRKLYWAVEDYKDQIMDALKSDLNKSAFESTLTEVDWIKNDCLYMIQH